MNRAESFAVSACAAIGPWGTGVPGFVRFLQDWRRMPPIALPAVPGFIGSGFNPLVYGGLTELARVGGLATPTRCALVVGSGIGDSWTADTTTRGVIDGRRLEPLLFYQSVPVSILGFAAQEFGILGPVVTISSFPDPLARLLSLADTLLDGENVEQVVVLVAAPSGSPRQLAIERAHGLEFQDAASERPGAAFALSLRRAVRGELALSSTLGPQGARAHDGAAAFVHYGALELDRGSIQGGRDWPLPIETRNIAHVCVAFESTRANDARDRRVHHEGHACRWT